MVLRFGANRATNDIDVLVISGNLLALRREIKEVGKQRNLSKDWMNEAVKAFADILPPDFSDRLTPLDFSLKHLKLYTLGTPEQAAMKIVALREQDLEDLELLLPQITEEGKLVLVNTMRRLETIRPDWAQKIYYFLLEQGWELA